MQDRAISIYLGRPSWPEQKALSLQIMPVVQKGAKVLVTGANGFMGAATIKILVERGFNVIGVVRKASKGACL